METLTPRQIKAIGLFCEGLRAAAVAVQVGCTVETLRRWGKDPIYKAALTKARREVWAETMGDASLGLGAALNTLQRIMLSEEQPAGARVSAARSFIELVQPHDLLDAEDLAAGDQPQVYVYLPDNQRGDRDLDGVKPVD